MMGQGFLFAREPRTSDDRRRADLLISRRSTALFVAIAMIAALAVQTGFGYELPEAEAAGGAYTLNFAAADPSIYIPPIPFPSDLTAPTGRGDGDPLIPFAEFNDGTSDVRVESLAPEDMALGQIVPFETKITVLGDTTPENGVITFVIGWNTLTTNGDDFGYDARADDIGHGVIGAFIDTGDGAHIDSGNDATVDSFTWSLINDEIVGIFTVSGLNSGDVVVLEPWLVLDDTIGPGVGGNVQSRLIDAAAGPDQTINVANSGAITLVNGDSISTGNQTVPLLKPSDFFTAEVDLSVTKTDDIDPIDPGATLTYTITAVNAGPSVANDVIVYDVLDPNVTFVSASDGGFINTDAGDMIPDGAVQWNVGAMAPGDSVVFTVTVTVNEDAPTDSPTGEDLINTVTVTTISDDIDLTNNTDTEPTDVISNPQLGITKTVVGVDEDGDGMLNSEGDEIDYEIVATNDGNVPLTNVTVSDPLLGTLACTPAQPATLAPSESITCTGSYAITQADLDTNGGGDGDIDNTATADSAETDPVDASQAVLLNTAAMMTVAKSADVASLSAAQTVTYSYLVTNTGNVTLTGISLSDDNDNDDMTCPSTTLAPGADMTCTATHTFTQGELDANGSPVADSGNLSNTVTAASNEAPDATDTLDIPITQTPDFTVTKSVTGTDTAGDGVLNADGDLVDYEMVVTNTGNVTLTNVSVADPLLGALACTPAQPATLAPGESMTCTGSYAITQADLDDNGGGDGDIDNTATASTNEAGSKDASAEAPLTQTPNFTVTKSVTGTDTAGDGILNADGDVIEYEIVVTNTGNVTLTNVSVSDALLGALTCTPTQPATLAPTEAMTCTGSYAITQTDLNTNGGGDGDIDNTATASTDEAGDKDATAETPLTLEPSLAVEKTVVAIDGDENGIANSPGDIIDYQVVVTNTGNVDLTPTVGDILTQSGVDTTLAIGAPTESQGPDGVMEPTETWTYTFSYEVTQADLDDGGTLFNEACASNADPAVAEVCSEVETPLEITPSIDISKTGSLDMGADGIATPGDVISYAFDVTNTGNVTLSGVTVTDPLPGLSPITCEWAASTNVSTGDGVLAVGESVTCSATYGLTQADIDAGSVENLATANGTTPTGGNVDDTDPHDETVPQGPALSVLKELTGNADEDSSGTVSLNDTLTYTLTATNDGNTTLNNVTVDDSLTGDSTTCASVAPGGTCVLEVTHVVTQTDVDAGIIENTGTADSDETPPDEDDEDVPVPQNPSIDADKALFDNADDDGDGTVSLGDTLTFRITATNDGNVTLTNVTVDDDLTGTADALCAATLAPGQSCVVDVTYVVTQNDVDAGKVENTGTVEGNPPTGDPVNDSDPEEVPVPQNPSIDADKVLFDNADEDGNAEVSLGDTLTYRITATNDGNVTLTSVTVQDLLTGTVGAFCAATLAPGQSCFVDVTYVVTQDDVDAGGIDNLGEVEGTDPNNNPVTDDDPEDVPVPQNPAIQIVKEGSFDAGGDGVANPGELITYTFTVTNEGNVSLTNVSVTDPLPGLSAISFDGGDTDNDGELDVTETWLYSATYAVTQADIDAGKVVNLATADSDESEPDDDGNDEPLPQNPALAVTKLVSRIDSTDGALDETSVDAAGDVIVYEIVVANAGNVTLTNVVVSDPLLGTTLSCPTTTLLVNQSMSCFGSYEVTQADINDNGGGDGDIDNTATADSDQTGPESDSAAVPVDQEPALTITKTVFSVTNPDNSDGGTSIDEAGDVVEYSIRVENTGNQTLTGVSVSDALLALPTGDLLCPPTDVLNPGDSITCAGSYVVTQADVDSNATAEPDDVEAGLLDNTATAVSDQTGPESASASVPVVQTPAIDLMKTASAIDTDVVGDPGDTRADAGDQITYTFDVENTGNVTLDPVVLDDTLLGYDGVTCGVGSLAPGGTTQCTALYTLTQSDVDAGFVANTADVFGNPPGSDPADQTDDASDMDDTNTNIPAEPSVTVVKSTDVVSYSAVGDEIDYTIAVLNDGNVSLSVVDIESSLSDELNGVDVTAELAGPFTDSGGTTPVGDGETLSVGSTWYYTYSYTVVESDLDDQDSVINVVCADVDGDGVPSCSEVQTPSAGLAIVKTVVSIDGVPGGQADSAGDIIAYEVVVTNTGAIDLSPAVDDVLTQSGLETPLDMGLVEESFGDDDVMEPTETWTYSFSFEVTQDILDDGGTLVNEACASNEDPAVAEVCAEVQTPLVQTPAIDLKKTASAIDTDVVGDPGDTRADAGDQITYTFDVENTGNVTLDPVVVDDTLLGYDGVTCGVSSLAPGGTTQCTALYTLTQDDVDAGFVANTADVFGNPPGSDPADRTDDASDMDGTNTEIPAEPALAIEKAFTSNNDEDESDTVSLDDTLFYDLVATNVGNVTLTNVTVVDSLTGDTAVCASVAPGGVCELTVTWVVTQADVDAGEITNVGTADSNETGPVEDPELVDVPQNPSIDILKSGVIDDTVVDPGDRTDAGDVIDYTFVVTNDGDVTLNGVSVTDPLTGLSAITCDWAATSDATTGVGELAVDESVTCSAEYTLLQSDIDAGQVVNTADTDGFGPQAQPVNDEDTNTEPITQEPQLAVNKSADLSEVDEAGDVIRYTVTVENTGNITLDPDVTDEINGLVPVPLSGPEADTGQVGLLDVGETWTFTGTYEVTQDDMDAGVTLTNVACADDPNVEGEDDCGEDTTTVTQTPAIDLVKTGTWNDADGDTYADAGETITYTFRVENIGNVTLTDVTLADQVGGVTISGGPIASLAPGDVDTSTFTGEYTLSQADVDAGTFENVALVTGTPPNNLDDATDDDNDIQNLPQNPAIDLVKKASEIDNTVVEPVDRTDAGDQITYTFTITNVGNVTLSTLALDDALVGFDDSTCDDADGVLAPTESTECTAVYEITQTDIDAGERLNTAFVSAEGPLGDPEDPADDATDTDGTDTDITREPSHSLTKAFIPNPVGEGDLGTFELVYENTGNVTLTAIDITDDVDERLVVQSVTSAEAVCSDPDGDPQTILCEVETLPPGETVTVTVGFIALGDDFDGIGDNIAQTSGANYVFYFANGYVLYGSTETGDATLLDADRNEVDENLWEVDGVNQDIFFTVPYAGGDDGGFSLHLSCSEAFIDGWGATGPIEGEDDPDWQVDAYDVYRFNSNGFLKDCAQTFPFEVPNSAIASATPPTGTTLADAEASDTLEVVNIAPIEVTRDRVRRGDVEIQYFNTSYEPLYIDIIRVEWTDMDTKLEFASYQDGVLLGIGLEAGDDGCYNGTPPPPADTCRLQANIDPPTLIDARSKDWLKLSFDSGDAPGGLTVTIVTDDGATFTYVFGS